MSDPLGPERWKQAEGELAMSTSDPGLLPAPPQELLDELSTAVNDEVLPRIEEAEAAWEDLQAATEDYEFELSLRGLREDIPPMVDEGKRLLSQGIESAIASQRGEDWYEALRDQLRAADNVYHQQLDQLEVPSFDVCARINGDVYDIGSISALTIGQLMAQLPGAMIEALMGN